MASIHELYQSKNLQLSGVLSNEQFALPFLLSFHFYSIEIVVAVAFSVAVAVVRIVLKLFGVLSWNFWPVPRCYADVNIPPIWPSIESKNVDLVVFLELKLFLFQIPGDYGFFYPKSFRLRKRCHQTPFFSIWYFVGFFSQPFSSQETKENVDKIQRLKYNYMQWYQHNRLSRKEFKMRINWMVWCWQRRKRFRTEMVQFFTNTNNRSKSMHT